jgi:hypothetical protein
MALWKNRRLHAVVRKVDEDGLDADNSPFLKSSMDEAIHTVRHTLEGGATIPVDEKEPGGSEQ